MKWTVVWVPIVERKLTRLWLRAADRTAIRAAADQIDRRLSSNPEETGESRTAGQRIVHEAPLGAVFQVSPADRLVQVIDIWWYGKHPKSGHH